MALEFSIKLLQEHIQQIDSQLRMFGENKELLVQLRDYREAYNLLIQNNQIRDSGHPGDTA